MQASISNSSSIKVSAAVANSRTSNGTIYTCPANSYAILNAYIATTNDTISVGGVLVLYDAAANIMKTIYVGPGQSVVTAHGASGLITVSGVEFINSP